MKIKIKSLTEKGILGINKYFPETTWFDIKCRVSEAKITREKKQNQIIITIEKNFANDIKNKTFVVWLIQDMKKDADITNMIDYTIEAKFK